MKKIKAANNDTDKRLDVFLSEKLQISRSQAQKISAKNNLTVNSKKKSSHYKIQADDIVSIEETTEQKKKKKKTALPKFKIVTETNDYLVINKPAGVVVHGGEGIEELTLVDALENYFAEKTTYEKINSNDFRKIGDNPLRPGIVHRLDKEASGLMVIAKTTQMFDHLKKQFQNRTVLKKYLALVYDPIDKTFDEINFPISRSAKGYKMAAHAKNQSGRRAITDFVVKQNFINYAYLDIKIKTGRTHQIRVHMSSYGHPIVGDDLYGTRKTREKNIKLSLNRVFLHAYILGFNDLQNKEVTFELDLPNELKKILKTIK